MVGRLKDARLFIKAAFMVVRLCRCMGFNLADFGWLILTVTSNADAWGLT